MATPGGPGTAGGDSQSMKFQNVTATISGTALVNKLKGPLIAALESDAAFRQAIVNAIMPQVRQVAASTARNTSGGKTPGK